MIFAGNWKLNLGPKASSLFIDSLLEEISEKQQESCFFFPQNLSLHASLDAACDSKLKIGAQNIYKEAAGAFTGENSLTALEEMGADICLIGHSERRSVFSESNELLNQKMQLLTKSKITPMLCIGENLEDRESGNTNAVLKNQLEKALQDIPESKEFYLAYEPVWAIGTGKVASPEMAEQAHAFIRSLLSELYSDDKANSTAILYGGSVKAENASDLAQMMNIDGFLIGGASLKVDSFLSIIRASR